MTKKNLLLIAVFTIITVISSILFPYLLFHFLISKFIPFPDGIMSAKAFWITAGVCFVALSVMEIYTVLKFKMFNFSKTINRVDTAESDAFGNSRWQTVDEMKKNYGSYDFDKLPEIEVEGYVIKSRLHRKKLYVSTVKEQHCLCVGTSGTGKSAFYLSVTIQMNAKSKTKSSMVINDLKGELYSKHSAMLAEQGYNVIKLDLRNPHISDRYNPLSLIWDLYQEYHETHDENVHDRVGVYINEIASILCPIGQGDQQQWSKGAQSIIKSVIWGMLEDGRVPELNFNKDMFTILQISNIVNRQKNDLESFLRQRSRYSPVFDYAGMILDNPSEKTVGSYYATLSTALEGFLEPGLQKVTSATDIDISEIALKPTAIFVIIPDELKTRNIVGTMIVSQIYNYLTFQASTCPGEKLPRNIYFLLDEFGNLPIIPNFPQWVALSRGRGIFFNLIVQADSQLEEVYGKNGAKTIIQNCHLQMLLGANEVETLKRFEDLFGKQTIYSRSANVDTDNSITSFKGSTGITSKELITLDQLQRIKRGTAYFKILREHPCQTEFVGIFEPAVSGILKQGTMKAVLRERREIDKSATYYDLAERAATVRHLQELLSGAPSSPAAPTDAKPGKPGGDRNIKNEAPAASAPEEEFERSFVPQGTSANTDGEGDTGNAGGTTGGAISRADFLKL